MILMPLKKESTVLNALQATLLIMENVFLNAQLLNIQMLKEFAKIVILLVFIVLEPLIKIVKDAPKAI
jgi:hypothetical protein